MSEGYPFVRVWGSVMHDGQPRAEVRDLRGSETIPEDGVFRAFRWARVSSPGPAPGDNDCDCAGVADCRPGRPCPACQQTAVRWWYEWDRRGAERKWRATAENAGPRNGWRAADWCPHTKGHPTEDAARKCAKKNGFPRIVEIDGHGKRLRWVDVGPVGMFGEVRGE